MASVGGGSERDSSSEDFLPLPTEEFKLVAGEDWGDTGVTEPDAEFTDDDVEDGEVGCSRSFCCCGWKNASPDLSDAIRGFSFGSIDGNDRTDTSSSSRLSVTLEADDLSVPDVLGPLLDETVS